jgi:SPP1 family predicted phage head-tail adaptor
MTRNAGAMDQRITLQYRVANVLPSGENKYTWANLATAPEVWAEANPVRGREFFAAAQMQAENPVAFRINYRSDIDATMRVVWRSQAHDIAAAPVDLRGAKESLWLYTVAGVRDGR